MDDFTIELGLSDSKIVMDVYGYTDFPKSCFELDPDEYLYSGNVIYIKPNGQDGIYEGIISRKYGKDYLFYINDQLYRESSVMIQLTYSKIIVIPKMKMQIQFENMMKTEHGFDDTQLSLDRQTTNLIYDVRDLYTGVTRTYWVMWLEMYKSYNNIVRNDK